MQNNESRGRKPKQPAHIKWSCRAARLARGEIEELPKICEAISPRATENKKIKLRQGLQAE